MRIQTVRLANLSCLPNVAVSKREFQVLTARRDAKVLKQAQEPSQFQTVIRIRQKKARIRALLARFEEAGALSGAEAGDQGIGNSTAAVHLDAEIELFRLHCLQKSLNALHLGLPFGKTGISRELAESVKIGAKTIDELCSPGQAGQNNLGLWKGCSQRSEGGHGAEHITQLESAKNHNPPWQWVPDSFCHLDLPSSDKTFELQK
jgi:hypothetical protein